MKFLSTIIPLSLFALSATAAPVEDADARKPTVGQQLKNHFNLKTQVKAGQEGKTRFDGLVVQLYHINADWQEFTVGKKNPIPFALNGTHLQTLLDSQYPYGVQLAQQEYQQWWSEVEVHAGYGEGKYFFDGDVLKAGSRWGGWRVCEWWHNEPQLFWLQKEYTDLTPAINPASCADVKLIKEPIY